VTLISISYIFGAFVEGAVIFIGGAIIFIGKRSLAVRGRLFKAARVRVVNIIKGVNGCNLRQ